MRKIINFVVCILVMGMAVFGCSNYSQLTGKDAVQIAQDALNEWNVDFEINQGIIYIYSMEEIINVYAGSRVCVDYHFQDKDELSMDNLNLFVSLCNLFLGDRDKIDRKTIEELFGSWEIDRDYEMYWGGVFDPNNLYVIKNYDSYELGFSADLP